jgi:hypothetical protein
VQFFIIHVELDEANVMRVCSKTLGILSFLVLYKAYRVKKCFTIVSRGECKINQSAERRRK